MFTPTAVGIDVSGATLDAGILKGKTKSTTAFPNTREGIEALIVWLREQGIADAPVVLESTGSLHWLACLLLAEHGFSVCLINPLITKKYQRASVRNAKTDKIDALRLAEIGTLERELPRFFDTRETLSQKRYQSLLAKLSKTKQELSRAYNDAVKSADAIGISLDLACLESCLQQLEEAAVVLKKIIEGSADALAEKAAEIPGISRFQATVLSTAVQNRTFATRDQLTAFFGLDVAPRQSGQWRGKARLTKRGNPFYRQVLFQIGWGLMMNNPTYKVYYQSLRDRDKHYYTAIIATARKFLRYYFRLYQKDRQKIS